MKKLYGGDGESSLYAALRNGQALHNDTTVEYELHYSYSTVANGRADRIVVGPGQVIKRLSKGSAHDFASWEVGSLEEMAGYDLRSLAQMQEFRANRIART